MTTRKSKPPAPDDLATVAECDEARDAIMIKVAQIEEDIFSGRAAAKAKTSLRMNKALLQRIQERRAALRRQERGARAASKDRILIGIIKEIAPELVPHAVDIARRRHPAIFLEGE